MNRLERLINLVAALLDAGRPLSRGDIQERVPGYRGAPETVRRAFERDKDTLRAMGIPLVVEPLDRAHPELGDGYRIPRERYELPDAGLTPEELAALQLAASTVRLEGGEGAPSSLGEAGVAIWKLGGATGAAAAGGPVAALPGSEHLLALFSAVGERRTVRFDYRGEERVVDPFRLAFVNGRWYLDGHDHARGERRRFRLDRLESPPRPGGRRTVDPGAQAGRAAPQPWLMGDEEEVEALLLVDADQADWAVAKVGEGCVRERRSDGAVVLALPVSNREAFRSFVLGFLDHAEVLHPPEVRHELLAWLRAMAGAA